MYIYLLVLCMHRNMTNVLEKVLIDLAVTYLADLYLADLCLADLYLADLCLPIALYPIMKNEITFLW